MLPSRIPRDASEMLFVIEKRLKRLELKGHGFTIPDFSASGVNTYSQNDMPTGTITEGSIWIDTNSSNTIWRYTNGEWKLALDPAIDRVRDEAAVGIAGAQDAVAYEDNHVVLHFRITEPPTGSIGDLWVKETDNILYRSDGVVWISTGSNVLGLNIRRLENLLAVADAKVNTWWQVAPPVAEGLGDLWVDTSQVTRPLYRWTNFAWQQVFNWTGPVFDALELRISTFYQATPPTSMAIGDIWYDTSNGNLAYRAGSVGSTTIAPDQWIAIPVGHGAISPNAIDEDNLLEGAVTFPKLRIGSFDNLVMNPGFEGASVSPHVAAGGTTLVRSSAIKKSGAYSGLLTVAASSATSTTLVTFNGAATNSVFHPQVQVDDRVWFSAKVYLETGTATLNAVVKTYSAGGALVETANGDATLLTAGSWTSVSVKATVSDTDSAYAVFQLGTDLITAGATIYIDDLYARLMLTGELLVDGTITADQMAANSITTDALAARSVTAEQLESDLVLSSAISTGHIDDVVGSPTFNQLIGQRVEISSYGIRLVDENETDIVTLPVDLNQPAQFNGQISTSSLRVLGGTSIEHTGNEIAKDATLMLSNGVTKPIQGPTLASSYESIVLDKTTPIGGSLGTFAFNPAQCTAFSYDVQTGGWIANQKMSLGSRIWRFTASGAIDTTFFSTLDFPDWTITGVTSRPGGGSVDIVGAFDGLWWLVGRYANDPNAGQRNIFTRQNTTTWPTIGWDSINNQYMVAETLAATDQVDIRRMSIVTTRGAFATKNSTTRLEPTSGRNGSLTSINYGPFDFASNRYIFTAKPDYATAWVHVGANGGAAITTENFPTAITGSIGFTWDGANFWSLANNGRVYKHSTWKWTDSNAKLFAAATYYDSDILGTGVHETNLGTITGITRIKRANIVATLPTVPDQGGLDDPDRWRLYTALAASTTPASTSFHLQATGIGATPSTPGKLVLSTTNQAGAAPPTTNGFPAANPAILYSSANDIGGNPLISLKGDGSGRMGPYAWTAGEVDSGWVNLTVAAGYTLSGVARCRKIGKLIHVQISSITNNADIAVSANGSITDSVIASVPSAYWPPVTLRSAGFTNSIAMFAIGTGGNLSINAADARGTTWTIAAGSPLQVSFMYFIT